MKLLRKRTLIICLIAVFLVLLVWALWANTALGLTEYPLQSANLPQAFDGFRIAQVSDLHNAQLGENNQRLLALLKEAGPDMIAITGDFVDSRQTDVEVALDFAAEAVKIAPVYYVPGNHESRIPEAYQALKAALSELGVEVLENRSILLQRQEDAITLTGLLDPDFGIPWAEASADNYQVVLSHRPELFHQYVKAGFDLVFAGHAHGGQFRLPFVGGLFAPHQGFFPEYDAGVFQENATTMVISRGLGNSLLPLRINNRPELIIVTLKAP